MIILYGVRINRKRRKFQNFKKGSKGVDLYEDPD